MHCYLMHYFISSLTLFSLLIDWYFHFYWLFILIIFIFPHPPLLIFALLFSLLLSFSPLFFPFLLFSSLLHHQWLSQYQGLTLTSRGQHSALPNLKIPICLFDTNTNIKNTNLDNWKNDRKDSSNNEVRNENENSNKNENKNEFKGEGYLSAESYVRYLGLYARRFCLESYMKLGYTVVILLLDTPSLRRSESVV